MCLCRKNEVGVDSPITGFVGGGVQRGAEKKGSQGRSVGERTRDQEDD